MKKIIGGILGIFLVIGIVAGTGYALFSDTVKMERMVLGTATPGLLIKTGEKDLDTYRTSLDFMNHSPFQLLLPGQIDYGEFWLLNNSDTGLTGPELDMKLQGRLTTGYTDWEDLKNIVKMRFCIYTEATNYICDETKATPWYTLNQWNIAARDLPVNLAQGAEQRFGLQLLIDSGYGNEISDKTITGITFEITGTQTVPTQ